MSVKVLQDMSVDNFTEQNEGKAFDPAIITVIGDLVMAILEYFATCRRDDDDAFEIARKPSRFQRWIMKSRIRRHMGWRAYRKHGREVYRALRRTGRDVQKRDFVKAYRSVRRR